MLEEKRFGIKQNKISWKLIICILLVVMALALIVIRTIKSSQSELAMYPKVTFEGEYRIGDGIWKMIVPGEHIPSTKGDVTLKGNFHMVTQEGEYIAPMEAGVPISFFLNHINLTIYEEGQEPYVLDAENEAFGLYSCGQCWTRYSQTGTSDAPVELVFHNPHRFGNENAIDDFLSQLSSWIGMEFEKDVLESGNAQRYTGILFVVVAMIMLGTALFATIIHMENSETIWLTGGAVVCAGAYFVYSDQSVFFWNDSITSNTLILGCAMMCYMLFLLIIMTTLLSETKRMGDRTVVALGAADVLFVLMPIVFEVNFYDTWLYWVLIQTIANIILLGCLMKEFRSKKERTKWIYPGISIPLIAYELDVLATVYGIWSGGLISKHVFIVIFFAALIIILQVIPQSVLASMKAKELEAEKNALNAQLAESRIATMISQIRPHFIYNTLGSIEQLCELDPPKAAELVHNFAKYLRGNFSELDNPKTIRMSQEMEHVKYYISIEKVRFPDMEFTFEINSGDFRLPALTIQPIIENAIKHGLMKLPKGGSVHVRSFETEDYYCISVEDDGVGFDTTILYDERKHIGLRNIRGRLEAMVSGTMEIESRIGFGTKVLIRIPKEIK